MTHTGIECFLAICRHKTASAAARALFITQPSLSARLKVLEQEVGAQLFYRNKGSREMQLTDTGREFHQLALQYEALIHKMNILGEENKNALRISCFSSLDTYLLPPVYKLFLQQNPQYALQLLDTGNTAASQMLLQGTADLAITVGSIYNRQLQRFPILTEPMVLVCAADSPLRSPVILSELLPQREVFVEWSYDFIHWHQEVLGYAQPPLCVSTMVQLRQFLELEKGWSVVPLSVANGLAVESGIRQLETELPLPRRDVFYVVHRQKPVPGLDTFLDCLRQVLSQHPEYELLL